MFKVCMMISVFIFFFSVIFLWSQLPHFLSVLLMFEVLTLSVFLMSSFCFSLTENSVGVYFCVVFLVFAVVEAVMGLSLLVSSSRGVSRISVKMYSLMSI